MEFYTNFLKQVVSRIIGTVGGSFNEMVINDVANGIGAILQVTFLNDTGMITLAADGLWRVPEFVYPSVREHLNSEGFLVDAL